VILTASGPATAGLIEGLAPLAAERIRTIRHGSTAVVTLAYALDRFAEPPTGHGFLVAADEPLAIDACTFSSQKWAGRAPDGTILLRCFVGSRRPEVLQGSDMELLEAAERDIATTLAVRGAPILARVARWTTQMPHYTVGHIERVDAAFEALSGLPGLVLAGAPYRGVGLPDCIGQGRAAASAVSSLLGGGRPDPVRATVAPAGEASAVTVPLDRLDPGDGGRVATVGPAHRAELAREGIQPGATLAVASAAPFGGPLVLQVGRARVALARSVAGTVEIQAARGSGPGPGDRAAAGRDDVPGAGR
jgi:Fe2+ transport system protein FeoA